MAYQEYVQKAIATGKTYDELPAKVKQAVLLPEWKQRVRELCIQQGAAWDSSQARAVCNELEYYEELIATYKNWGRLYPYHLAEYVARILRITPFRYYVDLLFLCLKEERSYDRIPNFTAADALRLTGVDRNEYIALMNTCKSKRLMWRLNKGLAKELLPSAPRDIRMEPWWRVCVVNVGESEFRDLSGDESALLRAAADGPRPLPVSAFDPTLLQQLYKKGLVYLAIPICPEDRFNIPPLEGFVSNKTSEAGDESVDPFEPLLYRLFLANSSRMDQARLADILGTDLHQLQLATALAVRLGFATRLNPGSTEDMITAAAATPRVGSSSSMSGLSVGPLGGGSSQQVLGSSGSGAIPDSVFEETAAAGAAGGAAAGERVQGGLWDVEASSGGAVAVVVDAETTSFLMMGALSAGLKRHSVSLFEGGRVSGEAVVDELITELQASAAAGAKFEGEDMAQLMRVIQSLGVLLACVKAAVAPHGHALELLRQESFAGLDPLSASKVLAATYTAIIPISPLPGHTLPRLLCQQQPTQTAASAATTAVVGGGGGSVHSNSGTAAPTFFGPPSPEADSPWLQLALYAAARAGPVSLVFVAGCRVWKLPPQLQGCTHALLWGWGPAAAGAAGGGGAAADTRPLLVEGSNLLCTLNELLSRTAVMVQPLVHLDQLPPAPTVAFSAAQESHLVRFVDVPLPLRPSQEQQALVVQAVDRTGASAGQCRQLEVPAQVVSALSELQLSGAVGWLRLVRLPPPAAAALLGPSAGAQKQPWVPLSVNLGVPLFCPTLCELVCDNIAQQQPLTPAGEAAWRTAQRILQEQLAQHVGLAGSSSSSSSGGTVGAEAQQGAAGPGGGKALSMHVAAGMVGGGVKLPAHCVLFDGHSLLPVDVGGCLQGAQLW